jgi:hypothetical protein
MGVSVVSGCIRMRMRRAIVGVAVGHVESTARVACVVIAIDLKVNEAEQVSIDQDDSKHVRSWKLVMVGQQLS